ncbi:hypothetical protein JJC03_01185 [Flavobacterium oreochromis]|uniref:hypothetical protein n=1 Tax=Flavobacterium oreochromis TaxID=2906078 RepID=UPI001CE5AA9E|nr:hypothetical protein [Flavobacterium oreochromis]QYS86707.1 hypothetical protein JJC03_01185 [Flavobacterium oreochromis]
MAFAVFAFVQITAEEFQLQIDKNISWFAFFGTIVGYNFIKYDELARVKKVVWHTQLRLVVLLSFVSAIVCGYYFFQLNRLTQLTAVVSLLLTGFYALPIVPKKTNFRNWSGVKIYLVALSWAIVTVLLPVFYSETLIGESIWIYFLQRFLIVFVLMLIFEIVDLSKDALSLQTIPQQIGVKKTKWLGYVLLVIVIGLEMNFNFKFQISNVLIAMALFFATPNSLKYYTSFWVEAIPIVWWVFNLFELETIFRIFEDES